MAITAAPYPQSFKSLGLGRFDFSTHTIKALLTTALYVPGETHEFRSDVTNEISGVGYTTGGETLTGLSWTYDAVNDWMLLGADPVVWTDLSATFRRVVIYRWTGTNATSPLLSWIDFGQNITKSEQDFPVTFTDGIYQVRIGAAV